MNQSRIAAVAATTIAAAVFGLAGAVAVSAHPADHVRAQGVFGETTGAFTYSQAYVPSGSAARVQAVPTASGKTVVTLHVWGLVPNREYGAHAHKFACGADPLTAGGHFQYIQGGATDPAFANDENEIWLDFSTDVDGNASAQTVVDWQFPSDRRAGAVVIHDHHTAHGTPGTSGTAGARYGCLTVAF